MFAFDLHKNNNKSYWSIREGGDSFLPMLMLF